MEGTQEGSHGAGAGADSAEESWLCQSHQVREEKLQGRGGRGPGDPSSSEAPGDATKMYNKGTEAAAADNMDQK